MSVLQYVSCNEVTYSSFVVLEIFKLKSNEKKTVTAYEERERSSFNSYHYKRWLSDCLMDEWRCILWLQIDYNCLDDLEGIEMAFVWMQLERNLIRFDPVVVSHRIGPIQLTKNWQEFEFQYCTNRSITAKPLHLFAVCSWRVANMIWENFRTLSGWWFIEGRPFCPKVCQ